MGLYVGGWVGGWVGGCGGIFTHTAGCTATVRCQMVAYLFKSDMTLDSQTT